MESTDQEEFNPYDFEDKKALITGASRGIGEQIALTLADYGADVVVNYNTSHDRASKTATTVELDGENSWVYPADVSDYGEVKQMKEHLEKNFGEIDILVNNAGITKDGAFKKMARENWDQVIRTNLDSVFNVTKQFADNMAERGWGRIINVASVNGRKGQFGQTNYAASKAGMHGFTMSLARELARKGVTVNTVAPGYLATEMVMQVKEEVRQQIIETIPVQRLGEPSEVASLIAYLASDDAGFVTGANIDINGGLHME